MDDSCRAVADRFGVAVSSVVKWSPRYRATGSVAPGKMGGQRKRVLEPHRAFIAERIIQTSHLSLHRPRAEPAERGVAVSHTAAWEFQKRTIEDTWRNLGHLVATMEPARCNDYFANAG